MKKVISLLLTICLLSFMFVSCKQTDNTVINIGALQGPTGMGMAKLIDDQNKLGDAAQYKFSVFNSPNTAVSDLVSKKLDMICLPTNTSASLNLAGTDISVIAINTLGSLYLMSDSNTEITSVKDLEGKTIYASVATSTTGPIIEHILKQNNVNATIEYYADHDALVLAIKQNEVAIAVLPEPKVSAAMVQNNTYSVDLNLSEEWDKISDQPLTMGCIVVRNDFLNEHPVAVDNFLKEYESSINYINNKENLESSAQMIVDAGIIPQLPLAKKSLTNLYGSISFISGKDMKDALESFYEVINQEKPKDNFYYVD